MRALRSRIPPARSPSPARRCCAGCTVGPDYVKPQVATPPGWRIDYPEAVDAANTWWWDRFGDPVLSGLADDGATRKPRSYDRRGTRRRVHRPARSARARSSTRRSTTTPTRAATAHRAWARRRFRRRRARITRCTRARSARAGSSICSAASAAESEAAQARVYASEQGRRGVVLSVVASVAASYITLRALDRQLEIARADREELPRHARDLREAPEGWRRLEDRARAGAVAISAGAARPFRRSSSRSPRRRT